MDLHAIADQIAALSPEQRAQMLNQVPKGLDDTLGMVFVEVSAQRVVVELTVTPEHLQPYGLVHGGVYCALAEAACSTGAAMVALAEGKNGVGIENLTRFRSATREGSVLRTVATPDTVDGDRHTWRCETWDGERLCAEGHVVVKALSRDRKVSGSTLTPPPIEGGSE